MGKTLDEAEQITNKAVAEALDGLPPVKMHCSNLAADACVKPLPITEREWVNMPRFQGIAVFLLSLGKITLR